jgi:hypothetical protein
MSAFLGEQAENCRRSTPKIRYVLTGAGVSFTKPPRVVGLPTAMVEITKWFLELALTKVLPGQVASMQ